MGCDIHFYVERQRDDGTWELFTPFMLLRQRHPNLSVAELIEAGGTIKRTSARDWEELDWDGCRYDHDAELRAKLEAGLIPVTDNDRDDGYESAGYEFSDTARFYKGRWYGLFSRLANVRNGDPSDPEHYIEPIAPERGVPDDASTLGRRTVEIGGDHSHSWATLRELQEGFGPGAPYVDEFEAFLPTLKLMAEIGPPDRVRALFSFDS